MIEGASVANYSIKGLQFSSDELELLSRPMLLEWKAFENCQKAYQIAKERLQVMQGINCQFDDDSRSIVAYHNEREFSHIISEAGISELFPNQMSVMNNPLSITCDRGDEEAFYLTNSGYRHFENWKAKCLEKAETFFKGHSATPRLPNIIPQIALGIIKKQSSCCLGEYHNEMAPKRFLIENMAELKEAGYTTLFLEHVFYDSMQTSFDRSHNEKEELPGYIKGYLRGMDRGFMIEDKKYGYLALVETALRHGIRIVGIDTTGSYVTGCDRKLGVNKSNDRLKAMNYIASMIVHQEQQRPEAGKFIGLMGVNHFADRKVPGIATILKCPALKIDSDFSKL